LNIRCLFSPPQGIDDTPIVGLDQRRASGGDEIMGYKPIESYGVIGDLHTVALVGIDGSIDWCCLPHFDSPSVFGAILDDQKGGSFRIASLYEAQHKQMYMPDSKVLYLTCPM
jgi:GH15 family glucan-1,4-alpha-glucosidase